MSIRADVRPTRHPDLMTLQRDVPATASRVVACATCDLSVSDGAWDFADQHADAIAAHWQRRLIENPAFFNGRIRMLESFAIADGRFSGRLIETGFREFLYWREHGEPEAGVHDCFGSAIIRAADGAILLARQRPGNINTGLAYFPGGFIDARDVAADGSIDIAASATREVIEETGLGTAELTRCPGFTLTFDRNQVSIGITYQSSLSAGELQQRIEAHIAADSKSELADVLLVRARADVAHLDLAPYARVLLDDLLREAG